MTWLIYPKTSEIYGTQMFCFTFSTFRQIPDNQEVFTHPVRDQSIIIEIMEAADPQEPDETAIKYVHVLLLLTV